MSAATSRTLLVACSAALAVLVAPLGSAFACSPAWSGAVTINSADTPECLRVSGGSFDDSGSGLAPLQVQNNCDDPVEIDCPNDPYDICAPTIVPAGSVAEVRVVFNGPAQWTIEDESGLIEYASEGEWGDCPPMTPLGCSVGAPRPTDGANGALGLLVFGLLVQSRRR